MKRTCGLLIMAVGLTLAPAAATTAIPPQPKGSTLANAKPTQDHRLGWSQLPSLPERRGLAGSFAGISADVLLVAGGANFPGKMPWESGRKVWYDTVYALKKGSGHWDRVGQLPRPLAYGVSVTTSSGVLCAGGSDALRHYRDVFLLTYTNGTLQTHPLPGLPVPLANAAGALAGSTLYIAGGSQMPGEQEASGRCFILDLSQPALTWQEIKPCPGKARTLPVAGAMEDRFYLFGGAALEKAAGKVARVYLQDAWQYGPTEGWQRLADPPQPCVAAPSPAPVIGGKLLLIGGDDGSLSGFQPLARHPGFPKTILTYDPQADRWESSGQAPVSRATVPAVFWNGSFVLPSGEARPGVRSAEVWSVESVP